MRPIPGYRSPVKKKEAFMIIHAPVKENVDADGHQAKKIPKHTQKQSYASGNNSASNNPSVLPVSNSNRPQLKKTMQSPLPRG